MKVILLDGGTGSAKTEILDRLDALGVQTLDLEGLAAHRGSLFGALPGRPQPSQKLFESRLDAAIGGLDPARPVLVEAESSKVGDRMVPPVLWAAMQSAPRIVIAAPREARAAYLAHAYRDMVEDRAAFDAAFARLPVYPGRKRLEDWRALIDAGEIEAVADALMEHHYDPAYLRSSRRDERMVLGVIEAATLDDAGQADAADAVLHLLGR